MSSTCPSGHPVLPSYEWCPYCMVKLERPVDDAEPAVEPPDPGEAPGPRRDRLPLPVSGPGSDAFSAGDADTARRQWPPGRWRLVLGAVGAALVISVAGAGLIDDSEGAPRVAVGPVPTGPTTATTTRETSSAPSGPTTTATAATPQPAPPTVAQPSPAVDEPCDPAAAAASSGSLRCVPIRWRDPTAPHVWWPIDEPVPGELDHEWTECRYSQGIVTATGSVRNDSDRPRGVVVTMAFLDARGSLVGAASAELASLAPGAAGRWTVTYDDPTRRVAECRRDGLGFP